MGEDGDARPATETKQSRGSWCRWPSMWRWSSADLGAGYNSSCTAALPKPFCMPGTPSKGFWRLLAHWLASTAEVKPGEAAGAPAHTCSRSRLCFRSSGLGSARLMGSTKGLFLAILLERGALRVCDRCPGRTRIGLPSMACSAARRSVGGSHGSLRSRRRLGCGG